VAIRDGATGSLTASSGLAPWSLAVDRDLWYQNFERGSRGLAPACCLPLWGREGVTLTSSTEGNPNEFYRAVFFVHAIVTRYRIAG